MAFRLYVVPIITQGRFREPKYFVTIGGYTSKDYGFEPVMVVGADLSTSDDNFVVGQSDVIALPFDLSLTLTAGQVNNVQGKLEGLNIPAGWVSTSLTWLQVVRIVLGMFDFISRFGLEYFELTGDTPPSVFTGGVTLNTTFGSLPANVRNAMINTAEFFNIPTAGLSAGTTLRVILRNVADFFQSVQYNFNDTLI